MSPNCGMEEVFVCIRTGSVSFGVDTRVTLRYEITVTAKSVLENPLDNAYCIALMNFLLNPMD